MQQERRYSYRVHTELPVICYPVDAVGGAGEPFTATATNISAKGVSLKLSDHAPLLTRLCLRLTVEDPQLDLLLLGDVVRAARRGDHLVLGLRFKGITTESRRDLTRWVFAEAHRQTTAAAAV